jgi:acyl dehydratase
MAEWFLEDFEVGHASRSDAYYVSRDEVIAFATAWDPQPFHLDDAAASASIFGVMTACSAHVFALFTKLANTLPHKTAALAGLGFDELRLPRPVRAGDTVQLATRVLEVRRSRSKPDRGVVQSEGTLVNQDGDVVFSAKSTFLVRARTATP